MTNVADYSRSRPVSAPFVLIVGTLLFLVALVPRILFVSAGPLQADEKHWNARTEKVLENFQKDPLHLTCHLGHPGVFPAFVMSASKVACSFVNRALGAHEGAAGYIDSIGAARIGNAVFSSVLPPLLFCCLLMWTGWFEALGIALIAALSPRAIDLSRLAHVDTIHAVVVAATVFSYLAALRFNDRRCKAWAGVFFGLCLLTKPTSIALLPALLISKVLLGRLWPETFARRSISWADFWTAVLSLAVFTLLYSRMWHHGETFIEWAAVSHKGPHLVYDIGLTLRSGVIGFCVAVLLIVGTVGQVVRWRRSEPKGWSWHLCTLALVLLAWLVVFPASWENLIRYWMRVFNLTSVKHQSFAGTTPPPPGGYLSYAIAELPPLVFIGLLLSPLLLVPAVQRALRPSEQQLVLVSTLVFGCWIAFLSSSPKQAWRYVIAAAPFCYVGASLALCALGRRYGLVRLPIVALVVFQCVAAVQAYPHWDLYQSKFAVVLDPAIRRELIRVRSGQQEALAFLIEEAKKEGHELFVSVLGDGDVFQREAGRSFGAERKLLKIGYFSDYASDYFIVQNSFEVKDQQWVRHMTSPPVFTFGTDFGAGISIYRPVDSEIPRNIFLPIQKVRNDIGGLTRVDGVEQLELIPSRSKPGYALVFPSGYRVAKGSSEFDFQFGVPPAIPAGIDPQTPVARFDVTRECSRVVTLSELAASSQRIIVTCPHEAPRRIFPRVYWFGKVPLSLVGVSVKLVN